MGVEGGSAANCGEGQNGDVWSVREGGVVVVVVVLSCCGQLSSQLSCIVV